MGKVKKQKSKTPKPMPVSNIKDFYQLLPHRMNPSGQWMVRIMKGEFAGIIYSYGMFQLNPDPKNDEATCRFQYDIIEMPPTMQDEEMPAGGEQRFIELAGEIVMDVLSDYIASGHTQEQIGAQIAKR